MKRTPAQIAEEILVLDAQAGNRQALGNLLTVCQPAILRHIVRLTGAGNSAQDIWQESAIAAMNGLRNLQDPALFRPWLYRITTFKCRDWQRKYFRSQAAEHTLDETVLAAPFSQEDDLTEEIRQVMESMDGEQRQLLALFYREGLSVQEVALALAITSGAVKTRLFRAREKFRKCWKGENDEQD
jgi:RNA polymerase sigma-70 factor (ECF subfamily)